MYSSNLEKIETIRDDGPDRGCGSDHRGAHRPDRRAVRRYGPHRPRHRRHAGRSRVSYTLSAQAKLVLAAHEVYLPKPKLAVEGPSRVQASFDLRGANNTTAGRVLKVILTNHLYGTGHT
jgi:hypothetical protein